MLPRPSYLRPWLTCSTTCLPSTLRFPVASVIVPPASRSVHRRRRWVHGLVIGIVAALVATSCAYGGTPLDAGALEVGDRRLSVSDLTAELDFLVANPELANALIGADTSAIAAGGAAGEAQERQVAVTVLNLHVYSSLLVDSVAREGGEITESARTEAAGQLAEATGSQTIPGSLSDALVDLVAAQQVLVGILGDRVGQVTEEEVRAAYDEVVSDAARFEGYSCSSHILVAFDPTSPGSATPTAEQEAAALAGAEAAAARLAAGEAFEAVASEVSDDTGSASRGGSLGCNFAGSFVPEFETALGLLGVGEISAVVRTDFGFHIIRLDSRGVPSFDDIEADIRAELEQAAQIGQEDLTAAVVETAQSTTVVVNPRFGTWNREQAAVVAPSGAAPAPGAQESLFSSLGSQLPQGQ